MDGMYMRETARYASRKLRIREEKRHTHVRSRGGAYEHGKKKNKYWVWEERKKVMISPPSSVLVIGPSDNKQDQVKLLISVAQQTR